MVMVMVMTHTLTILDPVLLTKTYIQQSVQSSSVWIPTTLLTTALIKFGIQLPLRRGVMRAQNRKRFPTHLNTESKTLQAYNGVRI